MQHPQYGGEPDVETGERPESAVTKPYVVVSIVKGVGVKSERSFGKAQPVVTYFEV